MSQNRIVEPATVEAARPYRMDGSGRIDEKHWAMRLSPQAWAGLLDGLDTRGKRADAFGNEFIVPELIHISKEVNKQVFPENTAARAFAPPRSQPPWFDTTYMYTDETVSGSPEDETGDWSDPGVTVGLSRKPNLSVIRPFPVNYSVNIAEMARYASIGVSPMADKAIQARRVAEQAIDIRAWLGRPNLGIPGYVLTPGISRDTVPTVDGKKTWTQKTGEQIYEDCRLIYNAILVASKSIWRPRSMWLPQKMETILTKPMVVGGVALVTNVKQYIEMNLGLTIDYTIRLNDINRNGAAGNGAVAMFLKSSDVHRAINPRGYYEMGPQQVGRTMTVYGDIVSGGLVVSQPTSAALWDGMCDAP